MKYWLVLQYGQILKNITLNEKEPCHKEPHTTSLHLMKRPEQTEGRPTAGWE